ncbi:ATP-binding protein [Fulvivirgaceae bacterium BMA12]|uniref:ATP-binding protein n=1 Tax=Agaribacillus aureus TaxID=3051825 RepID=A0ABT8L4A4_9BACT|nr:ATP-binding protein [Fulvivirgaceae bacterium BMA12]
MNIHELRHLVKSGENETLEFKRKAAHPEKIIKEIVAFANTKGGKLLIGVDDNGSLTGLKCVNEEQYVVNEAIQKFIKPKINFTLKVIPLNAKKSIISYDIRESENKPHYVIEDQTQSWGRAYVRVQDKTVKASKETREILKRKNNKEKGIHFRFGKKEKILMEHLEAHGYITLLKFQQIAGLSRSLASRTLVKLVLANVLSIDIRETEDIFTAKLP